MRAIHWFRSDLRIADNTALAAACRRARALVPVFVLDDALLERHRDANPRLRFLHACLRDLAAALEAAGSRLVVLRGAPQRCLPSLARACEASLVTWNRDYGPFAKRRDRAVREALERDGVEVRTFKDRVIFEVGEIRTVEGGTYSVYTHYRRAWWRRYQSGPPRTASAPAIPPCIPDAPADAVPSLRGLGVRGDSVDIPPGGAAPARARLDAFLGGAARRYRVDRDFPAVAGTSKLSPYLRFGALSVRECVRGGLALAASEAAAQEGVGAWIDELVWREFYHAILDAHPRVLDGAFREAYDALEWDDDADRLQAWRAGMTGYPIVDAGMRELAATGWMHNRVRMIVASFLVKDLHIDWREGERWFMRPARRRRPRQQQRGLAVGGVHGDRSAAVLPHLQSDVAGRAVRPGRGLRPALGCPSSKDCGRMRFTVRGSHRSKRAPTRPPSSTIGASARWRSRASVPPATAARSGWRTAERGPPLRNRAGGRIADREPAPCATIEPSWPVTH